MSTFSCLFRLLGTLLLHLSPHLVIGETGFFQLVDLHARAYSQKLQTCCPKSYRPMTNLPAFSFLRLLSGIACRLAETPQRPRAVFLSYAAIRCRLLVRYRRPNCLQIAIIYVVGTAREPVRGDMNITHVVIDYESAD